MKKENNKLNTSQKNEVREIISDVFRTYDLVESFKSIGVLNERFNNQAREINDLIDKSERTWEYSKKVADKLRFLDLRVNKINAKVLEGNDR